MPWGFFKDIPHILSFAGFAGILFKKLREFGVFFGTCSNASWI